MKMQDAVPKEKLDLLDYHRRYEDRGRIKEHKSMHPFMGKSGYRTRKC